MAAITAHDAHHVPGLHHQFEDIEQQNETYLVGMWAFLVQEVMFFGALFISYTVLRWKHPVDFWIAHNKLDLWLAGGNTFNLLLSSFFVAMAVRAAQLKVRKHVLGWLTLVQLCAVIFLVIKYFEYSSKVTSNLIPGPSFTWAYEGSANVMQMFFGLYFAMTGLHGIHVLAGIIVFAVLMWMWWRENKLVTEDYMPTEMCGLYWHFVDLVWIFLYPLFYLIPNPNP